MIIAALALLLLGLLAGAAGMRRLGRFARGVSGPWRPGVAGAALLAALGGLGLAARGGEIEGLLLIIVAAGLAVVARRRPRAKAPFAAAQSIDGMTAAEARDVLGVSKDAGKAEIEAAHRRLMARVHPDVGGANGLAVQINRARDTLLKPLAP
jgi:hypothetical protein